jgi:serine/threonine protein kinase
MAQELICRMLAYDPEKRIDWPELFEHPILKSKEEAMQDELSKTLSKDYNLLSDMSKFYLKQNMVILHPTEILKKELIVNLTIDIAKHKGKLVEGAKGDIFKRSGDQMQVVSTRLSKTRKLEN